MVVIEYFCFGPCDERFRVYKQLVNKNFLFLAFGKWREVVVDFVERMASS